MAMQSDLPVAVGRQQASRFLTMDRSYCPCFLGRGKLCARSLATLIKVSSPGGVAFYQEGMLVEKDQFEMQAQSAMERGDAVLQAVRQSCLPPSAP